MLLLCSALSLLKALQRQWSPLCQKRAGMLECRIHMRMIVLTCELQIEDSAASLLPILYADLGSVQAAANEVLTAVRETMERLDATAQCL